MIKVNNSFDIPYVGGYSQNGDTIYIDRKLPQTFIATTGQIVQVHKYLTIHEVVEKSVLTQLGLDFNSAHKLAIGAESAALARDDMPIDEYYGFITYWMHQCLSLDNIKEVPEDLDLTPYSEDKLSDIIHLVQQLTRSE